MLLREVEKVLRSNLNVIRQNIEKVYLCTLPYFTTLGRITIERRGESVYLSTTTLTYITLYSVSEALAYPYTTTKNQTLYGAELPEEYKNPELKVTCEGQEVIGYINKLKYLHLPDFIATQLLRLGIDVLAVIPKHILHFHSKEVSVYGHSGKVKIPYYLFKEEFDYYYDRADKLAELIGVFDVYKRHLLREINDSALWYFFYPYVSLILYRDLQTTLYPAFVNDVISDVINELGSEAKKVLVGYQMDTEKKLERLITELNGKMVVFKM